MNILHFHILANYLYSLKKNTIICLFSFYNFQGPWIKISFISRKQSISNFPKYWVSNNPSQCNIQFLESPNSPKMKWSSNFLHRFTCSCLLLSGNCSPVSLHVYDTANINSTAFSIAPLSFHPSCHPVNTLLISPSPPAPALVPHL